MGIRICRCKANCLTMFFFYRKTTVYKFGVTCSDLQNKLTCHFCNTSKLHKNKTNNKEFKKIYSTPNNIFKNISYRKSCIHYVVHIMVPFECTACPTHNKPSYSRNEKMDIAQVKRRLKKCCMHIRYIRSFYVLWHIKRLCPKYLIGVGPTIGTPTDFKDGVLCPHPQWKSSTIPLHSTLCMHIFCLQL